MFQKFKHFLPDKKALTNSAGPDQTAPSGAVWSEATLFAV